MNTKKIIIKKNYNEEKIKNYTTCAIKEALKEIHKHAGSKLWNDYRVDFEIVEKILNDTIKKIKCYKG